MSSILGFVFLMLFFSLAPALPGFNRCHNIASIGQCLSSVAGPREGTLAAGGFGVGTALLSIAFLAVVYRTIGGAKSGIAQVGFTLGVLGFIVLGLLFETSVISGVNLASLYANASAADRNTVAIIATAVSGALPGASLNWTPS